MRRRLSIVRSAEGLVEVSARLDAAIDWDNPWNAARDIADRKARVVIDERVLDQRDFELVGVWTAAQRQQPEDAALVAACLRLMDGTVLGVPRELGAFDMDLQTIEPFRATAAHPRAYKGTRDRRLKPPSPVAPLLGDVLLDLRAQRAFLRERAAVVSEQLAAFPEDQRDRLARILPPDCRDGDEGFDERLFALTGFDGVALDPLARARFLPQLRVLSARDAARVLAVARQVEADDERAALAAWWLALQPDEDGIAWLEWALALPGERCRVALVVLGTSGFVPLRFSSEHVDWLPAVCATDPDAAFASALRGMAACVHAGGDPGYRRGGIELMAEFDVTISMSSAAVEASAPVELLRTLAERLVVADIGPYVALEAWLACGRFPGLGARIASVPWDELTPETTERLLGLLGAWADLDEPGSKHDVTWVASQLPAMLAALARLPPERGQKFVAEVAWTVDNWGIAALHTHGDAVLVLAERLAGTPFKPDGHPVWIWNSALEYGRPDEVLDVSDRAWRHVDAACRRRNQEQPIAAGFDCLAAALGDDVAGYLEAAPARLVRAARSAGALSRPRRVSRLEEWARDRGDLAPDAALERLDEMIAAAVLEPLSADPGARTDAVMHAALLRASIEPNRRALGRFLRRYLGGDAEYIENHQLTRAWIAAHPAVRLDRLRDLPARTVELREIGEVSVSIERDPLEVLRLGTYVGSCLSLGGAFSYSAAAIALDVNKLVVYVRNCRGSVLARQLLAISEQDQLVRFEVYPGSASEALVEGLMTYAQDIATELGIAVYDPNSGEECEIGLVLANDWWDDGPA